MDKVIQYPKYYAFDWDDNLLYMDTKVHLSKDGEQISIGTEEFAKIRDLIGKGVYELLEENKSFESFTKKGDEQFMLDAFTARQGPSWKTFVVDVINEARIFSIITARGHSRDVFKKVIKQMILTNHMGIEKNKFIDNMHSFLKEEQKIYPEKDINIKENENWLINKYMKLNQFYPVANKNVQKLIEIEGTSHSPEQAKGKSLLHFKSHILTQANNIYSAEETVIPKIGISDDDKGNVEFMKLFLEQNSLGHSTLQYLWDSSEGEIKHVPLKKKDI